MNSTVLFAFGITLLAGLATCLGSLFTFFTHYTNKRVISLALGFSAGVMIFISFTEIFPEASHLLAQKYGDSKGYLFALLAFLGGVIFTALIDKFLLPDDEDPHNIQGIIEDQDNPMKIQHYRKFHKIGLFTAIALAIHNFPEGLVTFVTNMNGEAFGIPIAIAIIIHNIPEGVAIALPIYFATQSRKKAFFYTFLAGIAEPIGAVIGYLFLKQCNDCFIGLALAAVSGIMIFISFDELFPTAQECGKHGEVIIGLISGMIVMGLSIVFCL